jgi:predicted methyltransferase
MEETKMKKEKKELVKKFKVVIEDLLDNYEQYTDEEKAKIKEVFQKVAELNKVLDKYDDDGEIYWAEYLDVYSHFFNTMGY